VHKDCRDKTRRDSIPPYDGTTNSTRIFGVENSELTKRLQVTRRSAVRFGRMKQEFSDEISDK